MTAQDLLRLVVDAPAFGIPGQMLPWQIIKMRFMEITSGAYTY